MKQKIKASGQNETDGTARQRDFPRFELLSEVIKRPILAHSMNLKPYGRLTTRDGTKYLYERCYCLFARKRPGRAPEPYDGGWPSDVVEEFCFGDERDRTRRGPPVLDPWNEQTGWEVGCWRPRRRAAT